MTLVALGDSATVGIGDPLPGAPGLVETMVEEKVLGSLRGTRVGGRYWRGWSRLLCAALEQRHDVAYHNLAIPGATAADVLQSQLPTALDTRPALASLVVGVNDTLRPAWDPQRTAAAIESTGDALAATGAHLLLLRFHDIAEILGLPGPLRRMHARRLAVVNEAYTRLHERHASILLDLPRIGVGTGRELFTVDRLHPSERGHRRLAAAFAEGLRPLGYHHLHVPLSCDGREPSRYEQARWLATDVVPWMGRRIRELGTSTLRGAGPWVGSRA